MLHGPWIAEAINAYLSGRVVKAMAMDSTHVPAADTTSRDSLTGELEGGGYDGGVVVAGFNVTWDSATSRVFATCDPVDFGAVTATGVSAIVFYVDNGSAYDDRVLWTDAFTPVDAAGALSYEPSAEGLMEIVV